jgi:hypothetical protein
MGKLGYRVIKGVTLPQLLLGGLRKGPPRPNPAGMSWQPPKPALARYCFPGGIGKSVLWASLYTMALAADPSHPLRTYWKWRSKEQHTRQFWDTPPFWFRDAGQSVADGLHGICVPSIAPRTSLKKGYNLGLLRISSGVPLLGSGSCTYHP